MGCNYMSCHVFFVLVMGVVEVQNWILNGIPQIGNEGI